jgi:hypothetical protein
MTAARVVFPDPGMPDMAIRKRFDGATCWNLSVSCQRLLLFKCHDMSMYPRFA